MKTTSALLTSATAAFALSIASSASAASFSKSFDWGDNNFGVEVKGSGSGSLNGNGKISIDGEGVFKAKLFGGSKTAKAEFSGKYGDGTKKMEASFKIDGIQYSHKTSTFGATYVSHNLASHELFHKSKQFTLWGVPVVVIADVSAGASIGFGFDVDINGSIYPMNWDQEYEVYGSVGAAGTITAGPGTDLAGVGVYGSITIGEITLAAVKKVPYLGGGNPKNQLQVDLDIGTFEVGVKAWVAGAEVSKSVLEVEGFHKNIKTINL